MIFSILIPLIIFMMYNRTMHLIKVIKYKKKVAIKFELLLFFATLITAIMLLFYAASRDE